MTFLNRYQPVILHKQDIHHFPFEDYTQVPLEELERVAVQHKLPQYNSWMLPQMLAYFGTWTPKYNAQGLVDAQATALHNLGSDPKMRGLYLVASKLPRGKLVKQQNSPQGAHYGALVPLVLAGFKKYQGIPYSRWERSTVKFAVDKNLAQAMLAEEIPELTRERLLEIRREGLTTKTGKTAGQSKNALSTWSLTGIADTEIGHLPKLAQTMLTQIWLAHPSLRNEYMVLDPLNWDAMPPPLLESEIFKVREPGVAETAAAEGRAPASEPSYVPWEV